jgi:hypothetical protein
VNATTITGVLEYSIDNGLNYQTSNTFSGLPEDNYTIKAREQGSASRETYTSNPVIINALLSYTDIYVNKAATESNSGTSWADVRASFLRKLRINTLF